MKKTFIFGLMAAALGFTACSSEDDSILGEKTQKKGMVLNATVEQPAETRATIDNTGDHSTNWSFAFATGDKVKVTNTDYSGFYTFEKNATNFASDDAEVTASPVTWYAFYPSNKVDFANQTGELTGDGNSVANLFAMAGATTSDVTGADALSITMVPKVAIIKIDNQKGSIDIRVKYENGEYIDYLEAPTNDVNFTLNTTVTPNSVLTATTTGTYYIVVPAGSGYGLSIYDGTTEIRTTTGLEAGMYYELTIADPNLLLGDFSVSTTKKVKFAKSNLYWDGSAFKFEAKQTDYPTTWDASHVGHFYWTKTQAASYADAYDDGTTTDTDVPFFAESEGGLTVEGTSGLYALSYEEWLYLKQTRTNASNLYKAGVTVGSAAGCLIIAPDDFSGTLSDTYTLDEVTALGLVCLPRAGQHTTAGIQYTNNYGYYWSSKANGANYAYCAGVSNTGFNVYGTSTNREYGCSLRLVK